MKVSLYPLLAAGLLAGTAACAQAPAIPPPFATPTPEPIAQTQAPAPAETGANPVPLPEPGDLSAEPGPDATLRDPFWPVGYVPEKKTAVSLTPDQAAPAAAAPTALAWDDAQKMLTISGISRVSTSRTSKRAEFMAIVNGKLVEEGDDVALLLDGVTYHWQVQSIGPSGVALQRLNATGP